MTLEFFNVSIYHWAAMIAGVLVILILIWIIVKRRRRGSVYKEIHQHRLAIRSLDKLLADLESYFKKVESKYDLKYSVGENDVG